MLFSHGGHVGHVRHGELFGWQQRWWHPCVLLPNGTTFPPMLGPLHPFTVLTNRLCQRGWRIFSCPPMSWEDLGLQRA